MALIMKRGRLQSLFAYLPEQTYNWESNRGRFKGSSQVDTRPLDIPHGWITRPLLRLFRGFTYAYNRAGQNWQGEDIIRRGEFELLEPRTLRGEYYPKMFICPACGRFSESDDNPRYQNCSFCDKKKQQIRFVEYHRCGHIDGLKPPRCQNGCNVSMMLRGPGGKSITDTRLVRDWRWSCSKCRTPGRGVIYTCRTCRRESVRVLPSDASQVYYPQYITVINPPSQADYQVLESLAIYPAAIAQSLGLIPEGVDSLRMASNNVESTTNQQVIRQSIASLLGLDINNPAHQHEIDLEINRVMSRRQSVVSTPAWEEVVDNIIEDEEIEIEVGEECISLALAREASPVTISDLAHVETNDTIKLLYGSRYPQALKQFGLAEVTLLQEFPIAHVVAGYTREESNPNNNLDNLLSFNFFSAENGKYPMYGQRVTTEALLFRLDPSRVVDWLSYAGMIDNCGVENSIEEIFSRMKPIMNIFEPPQDILTTSILGLVHSFSHKAIRALARLSGLKADSLSEYILPFNLTFIIYPGARSEFVLGGLEHVFRNYLDECLRSLVEQSRCVFDPPCSRSRGACAVCLFIGEVACERFNTALSRHYLFGGQLDEIDWCGYWYM